jgi:hypothetical protein
MKTKKKKTLTELTPSREERRQRSMTVTSHPDRRPVISTGDAGSVMTLTYRVAFLLGTLIPEALAHAEPELSAGQQYRCSTGKGMS